MKTIYYYQTFVGLHDLMNHVQDIDVIIVSSLHFGKDKNNQENIFLNDNIPYDPVFNELWLETEKISVQGCTIMLMMGGAGFAYKELFSDPEALGRLAMQALSKERKQEDISKYDEYASSGRVDGDDLGNVLPI